MWKITVGDEEIREGDLTIGQAEDIEEATGLTWREINPLRTAKMARVIASVVLADRQGVSVADVLAKCRSAKVSEILDSFDTYDDTPQEYVDGNPLDPPPPTTT